MPDPWVENTQQWLNDTYTGVPGWDPVAVTGNTGWPTMFALTRALQHELGITSLSDSFGPGTLAALSALGSIGPATSTTHPNIVRILQGGMYCKGYDGGNGYLDGDYSAVTEAGIGELRGDMGLSPTPETVPAKVFKALLTMDAYVLLPGGATTIRGIQRNLNGRYFGRQDFFIIPADGIYSRDVQRGMMFALQYEIGMADGVANGNFGPGTQTGLATQANFGPGDSDGATGKYFIHLFQAALLFNGYPTVYDGVFSTSVQTTTNNFQAFCLLPVSGRSDYQTWASLLVSTGDVNRPGRAADTIRQITSARGATLVSHGYETIGRYLSNEDIPGAVDKYIKPGELADIFAAGLTIFPIFQEGGVSLSYFNYSQGYIAGQKAHDHAFSYGFISGTVIYFAVDYDAMEAEVYSNIVPYFSGIRDGLASRLSSYNVGIYGSRNTCTIVSSQGLAIFSFVSGMSTGFSGNLGYPLPYNWAFDQILEYEIGSGDGWVNIDKDIKSGRDLGQSLVNVVPPPTQTEVDKAIIYCFTIQSHATTFYQLLSNEYTIPNLTARFLRHGSYSDVLWTMLGGHDPVDFYTYVDNRVPPVVEPLAFRDTPRNEYGGTDWPHMLATCSVYVYRGPSASLLDPELSDQGGWTGDLITLAAEYIATTHSYSTAYSFAVAALNGTFVSTMQPMDVHADIYGWVAAYALATQEEPTLAHAIQATVNNTAFSGENSFDTFIRVRWGSVANGYAIAKRIFTLTADTPDRIAFIGARTTLLASGTSAGVVVIGDLTTADIEGIAKACVNKLATLSNNYSPLP